jgi:hypothetical protein
MTGTEAEAAGILEERAPESGYNRKPPADAIDRPDSGDGKRRSVPIIPFDFSPRGHILVPRTRFFVQRDVLPDRQRLIVPAPGLAESTI